MCVVHVCVCEWVSGGECCPELTRRVLGPEVVEWTQPSILQETGLSVQSHEDP